MNSEDWFLQYDEKLKEAAKNAERADQALREVGGSATSQDGNITVRVNASGATTDIVLRPDVRHLEPEHLARVLLQTTKAAQRDVGTRVVEAMKEFVGDSPALDVVKEHLPEGHAGDGRAEPELRPDTRPDDDYFNSPPQVFS